jgi:aryl-alcohol dehydrogenase (NADP+)
MYAWQFLKMLNASSSLGLARFVTMQNHYNLVYREEEREMIPLCLDQGIGLIPWSPLARGFLTGNRPRSSRDKAQGETLRAKTDDFAHQLYYRDSDFTVVDRITEIAKKHNAENAQIALAWILTKPGVSAPIIGASKQAHLDSALHALDLRLSPEEMQSLEEPYEPHPVLGHS